MKCLRIGILLIPALFLSGAARAQIPNSDFEIWDSVTLMQPSLYRVYGQTNRVPGYQSNSAVRLQRNLTLSDGPGAVLFGNPDNNFSGGIPVQARPDSAVGFFRYHLKDGDSAWFLVFLKRDGRFISQDIFHIGGSDSLNFRRLAFKINFRDTGLADSLVIGVASTNPNADYEGSFVVVDSLHFTGGTGSIQVVNGNFEQWDTYGYRNPRAWVSSNSRSKIPGLSSVEPSTDYAYSGLSCKIQNIPSGSGEFLPGSVMAGRMGGGGLKPAFAVQGRDSLLYCSYKCYPKGGDAITIAIFMFKNGSMMGLGQLQQPYTINSWSLAAIPIEYWNQEVPDSAAIYCAAFRAGETPKGASVLYVDGLKLNTSKTGLNKAWIPPAVLFPMPVSDKLTLSHPMLGSLSSLLLTDVDGKTLDLVFELSADGKLLSADVSGLAQGIWLYTLILGPDMRVSGRLLIQR